MDARSVSNLLSKEIDLILNKVQTLNFRDSEHIKDVTQFNIVKLFYFTIRDDIGKMFLEHLRVKWPGYTFEYKGCVKFKKKENENDFDIRFDTADQSIVFNFRFSILGEPFTLRPDDVPMYKIYSTIIPKTTVLRIPGDMKGRSPTSDTTAQPSSFSSMFSWCCC